MFVGKKMLPPARDTGEAVSAKELRRLRLWLSFFRAEHRLAAYLFRLLFFDRSVSKSLEAWLEARKSTVLPVDESVRLLFTLLRRLSLVTMAGFFGFLITTALLLWQNNLTSEQNDIVLKQNDLLFEQNRLTFEQNRYYRVSNEELRRQNAAQERRDLIAAAYDVSRPMRMRVESVKALVALERSPLTRSSRSGATINLQHIQLGCQTHGTTDCANLSSAPLARVDFTGANLRGASLKGADLRESVFLLADLSDADLAAANLRGTKFREEGSWIKSLPLDRLAARLETRVRARNRSRLKRDAAVEAAIRLKIAINPLDLDTADPSALPLSAREILYLNAASSTARVEDANWGHFGARIDRKTRLPFGLVDYVPSRVYEP